MNPVPSYIPLDTGEGGCVSARVPILHPRATGAMAPPLWYQAKRRRALESGGANARLGTVCQSVWLRVVAFGPTGPIYLNRLTIDFALDGNQGVEELVSDVGEDGGATRGDAILDDEDKKFGKELVDLLGGLKIVESAEEIGGKVDINGLCGLELQCGMAKTKARADGTKATLPSRNGDVMAFRIGLGERRSWGGAGFLRIHGLSFWGRWLKEETDLLQGYTPRDDRKSVEAVDSKRVAGAPSRKRVRKLMKERGLQVCDRREKGYWVGAE